MAASQLVTIYEDIWKIYEGLEASNEDIKSENIQSNIKTAVGFCLEAIDKINKVDLFSDNEDIEEVTTNELKYLLIPAFFAYFINKDVSEEREAIVTKCKDLYRNFLVLCRQYNLTTYKCQDLKEANDIAKTTNPLDQLKSDAVNRQQKIERYKARKHLEQELKSLYTEVKKSHVDEDIKREYFLKLIEKWISDSIESLESLQSEEAILHHIKAVKKSVDNGGEVCKKDQTQMKKFQPFIITKDKMQKSVFGYGYPGIPTVSVDEFYDQRVRDGIFPSPSDVKKVQPNKEEEEAKREEEASEKDEKVDVDDEGALEEARRWDDYKDTHRRGWGNRHNRS